MARGDEIYDQDMTPAQLQEQELMFRGDLAEAVGMIIAPPMHHIDDQGHLIWGQGDGGLTHSNDVVAEFRETMEQIVEEVAAEYAAELPLRRTLPSHRYTQPPAAQDTLEFAFMLWEHKDAVIDNIDRIITVGTVVTLITQRAKSWFAKKQESVSDANPPDQPARWHNPIGQRDPIIAWTQLAAASAIFADAFTRYGIEEQSRIQVFPRALPYSGGPDHPNSLMTYLVRLQDGNRVLIYHMTAGGEITEHYQLAGDRITPLPLPSLFDEEEWSLVPFKGLSIQPAKPEAPSNS